MDKKKKEIKDRLRNMTTVAEFENILNTLILSEEEKQILRLIYREKKTISYIASVLGVSESVIKKKHSKLLMKIGGYF